LNEAGIKFVLLDGRMKRLDRNASLETFKNDPEVNVILLSLKAGGVGLNLTEANRVYIIEPYWNPAVESQAVDRVHRYAST
jgi:SWI/SNF-related matrix-associated actin-dependent regulator of chromatin subfamily A3